MQVVARATTHSADTVLGGVLKVTLGAEYAVGDIITLTLSGAALESGMLTSITSDTNAAISSMTIGLLSTDASTATYRVTDVTPGTANTTVGVIFSLAADMILTFDAPLVDAAGTVVVAFSAATDTGLALDTGTANLRTVGSELGVRALVTGRVMQRGETLVIGAELTDLLNVAQLWGEQYNRRTADILSIQDEIVRDIARGLQLSLSGEQEKQLSQRPTESIAARIRNFPIER